MRVRLIHLEVIRQSRLQVWVQNQRGDSTLSAEILEALLCLDDAERHTNLCGFKAKMNGQAEQRTPTRHKAQRAAANEMPSGLLLACKGLTSLLHSLTHLVEHQAPDFIILTKTRLSKTPRYRKKLTEALEDYVVHTNCKRDTSNMREGQRIGAAW